MSDGSKIEWTDASWNPIRARRPVTGGAPGEMHRGWACEKISAGCTHCYAETMNKRLGTGLPYIVSARGNVDLYLDEKALAEPLRWKKPRRVFVGSMTDVFGDWVPDGWLVRLLFVMRLCPQHTFQILTKRPARMRDFFTRWDDLSGEGREPQLVRGPAETRARHPSGRGQLFAAYLDALAEPHGGKPPSGAAWPTFDWMEGPRWWPRFPLHNVWLGTSVEDQPAADSRIPELLATPAAMRFLSCEPLLGPVSLYQAIADVPAESIKGDITWCIVGGESGPGARPCDLAWVRSIMAQCRAAGVAVFVKQLGSRPVATRLSTPESAAAAVFADMYVPQPDVLRLRDRKGGAPEEWPEDLRVREYPGVRE